MARSSSHTSTTTTTLTIDDSRLRPSDEGGAVSANPQRTLVLRLSRPKKKVTWKEGTVDNEFLQRKSSKKCCIFHKEKPFDEDDSDADDDGPSGAKPHGHRHPGSCSNDGGDDSVGDGDCCSAN